MKVEIIIDNGNYAPSHKDGVEYVGVSYMARLYGGASPCDTESQVQDAIAHAEARIRSEGDVPVIRDLRNRQTTLSLSNQMKGGDKQMESEAYVQSFKDLVARVGDKDVAIAILTQVAKDRRTSEINAKGGGKPRMDPNGPPTPNQQAYLKRLGLQVPETAGQASRLIDDSKGAFGR